MASPRALREVSVVRRREGTQRHQRRCVGIGVTRGARVGACGRQRVLRDLEAYAEGARLDWENQRAAQQASDAHDQPVCALIVP